MESFLRKNDRQALPRRVFEVWRYRQQRIFFVLLVVVLLWSGWQWYHDFCAYEWTPEQQAAYRSTKLETTQFHEEVFQNTLDMIEGRRNGYVSVTGDEKDIFQAGK